MNIGTDLGIDLVAESEETNNYVGRKENSKNYSVPISGNYFKGLIKSWGPLITSLWFYALDFIYHSSVERKYLLLLPILSERFYCLKHSRMPGRRTHEHTKHQNDADEPKGS